MANAVQRFREAIEAVHAGRAEARLAWWRRAERDESWRRAADALLSEQGEEWISEAQAARVLTPEQDALCVQQRALLAAQTRQAPLAQLDARLFTTKVPCGSEALPASAILDALLTSTDANTGAVQAKALGDALGAQARERCELRSEAELTLQAFGADLQPAIAARKSAETFLRATDDAASELVPWLTHAVAPRSRAHAHALLCSLRRRELDGFAKADRRFYRLTEGLRRLGFERDLNGRVRAEPCAPGVFPSLQRWAARDVPRDVRVAGTVRDLGVLSDFDGAAAIGGGLALALVSPVLAAEERLPLAGAVPEAFAGMMLRLRADRLYLRRCEGLSARDAENVARHFAILLLLATRASAALELAAATHARNLAEREEALAAALARAQVLDLPSGFAALAWSALPLLALDLRGKLAGLALHVALREHFDEDWFMNARAAEPLRGAATRGNAFSAEAFCAELGGSFDAASGSLLELLA